MIEVFKTDVGDRDQANRLIDQIHKIFVGYQANFDLEDCDRILRIRSVGEPVRITPLIDLLHRLGTKAEVLPDIVRSASSVALPTIPSGFAGRPNR